MPICKNCKRRIERFSKDRCPICGVENPFEGMSSDTVEITTNIDVDSSNTDYNPRTKKSLLLLFCIVGFTGMPFFYLKRNVAGLIHLLCNLGIAAVLTVILFYFAGLHIAVSIVIALVFIYLVNSALGLYFYKKPNLKDGNEEFVI